MKDSIIKRAIFEDHGKTVDFNYVDEDDEKVTYLKYRSGPNIVVLTNLGNNEALVLKRVSYIPKIKTVVTNKGE